jgi:Transposase zinc-binding domain
VSSQLEAALLKISGIPPWATRSFFAKAMQCRTPELGAEVYSSENQELVLYHTCKSRACPSCGHRANVQWLRERWAALPTAPYKGITFTMPDLLWSFFRDNPFLIPSSASSGRGGHAGTGECEAWLAGWRHCDSPHL